MQFYLDVGTGIPSGEYLHENDRLLVNQHFIGKVSVML